jgi:hypothetical protein
VSYMPAQAKQHVQIDEILSIENIGEFINSLK